MSIYTLYHAPIGTCTANAWGAGTEVREACGLLTSFLIFRMSLYFPHAARYLPKAHESQNQHICLPPDLSHTCFKSLHKVEIYFLEFAERFWSSAFSYIQPLPHLLGAGGALALSEDTHPSPASFPLLLPDERNRSAQYRAFCSCIQEQDFDDYKLDKSLKSSLLKRWILYKKKIIHCYSIWDQTNDIHCTLTFSGQSHVHLPLNDKSKASLLHCNKESLERESFCPGTAYLQTAVLLIPQLR